MDALCSYVSGYLQVMNQRMCVEFVSPGKPLNISWKGDKYWENATPSPT